MARPTKQPEEKRDLRVAFRLSAPDAEVLGARAKAAGLPLSAYVRAAALSGEVAVVERRGLDFETLDALRRIGVNLNQLVRAHHRRGFEAPDYLRDLCGRIETVIDQALDAEPGRDRA